MAGVGKQRCPSRAARAGRPPSPGAHGPHPFRPPRPFRLRAGAAPGAGRAWGARTPKGPRSSHSHQKRLYKHLRCPRGVEMPHRLQGRPQSSSDVPQNPTEGHYTFNVLTKPRSTPKSLGSPLKPRGALRGPHRLQDTPIAPQMSPCSICIITETSPTNPKNPRMHPQMPGML